MKRNNILIIQVFITLAGCLWLSGQSLSWAADDVGIKIMRKEMVGEYLADGTGMSLYSFNRDEKDTSNCLEGCAVNWPPFYTDLAAVIEGCDPGNFSTITRTDGRRQTTYNGLPLYYFKNDKYPGDTFGQGLGDVWFLVTP